MAGAELGRGTWRAPITARGGGPAIVELPATNMTMGRAVDQVSAASISVHRGCTGAGVPREWEHELNLYRYGNTTAGIAEKLAWAGPVLQPVYTPKVTTLACRDLLQHFERRRLRSEHDFVGVGADLATIFQALVDDAMASDLSPNIVLAATATGIVDDDFYVPPDSMIYAMDRMRVLMRAGLDVTAVGRIIRVGGEEVPAEPIATLGDDDFAGVTVTADGVEFASAVAVTGQGGGQNGWQNYALAGGVDASKGLVDRVFAEPDLSDRALQAAADSRVALLGADPVYITGVLKPSAPVTFDQLIPGARLRAVINNTDRPVDQSCRLASVRADVGATGERVTVQLIPLGASL